MIPCTLLQNDPDVHICREDSYVNYGVASYLLICTNMLAIASYKFRFIW